MSIRILTPDDISGVMRVWNACVDAGDVLYYPLTGDYFRRKFILGTGCEPENLLVAEEDGRIVGMAHGVAPETFPGGKPGNAYLTCILVDPAYRGRGIGKALLENLKAQLKAKGGTTLFISSINPVNLDWRIPNTPGHDHNNMPGLDNGCAGFGFFGHMGFEERHHEVAMYQDLSQYKMDLGIAELQEKLKAKGIVVGDYDYHLHCDFDKMCDAVGSDYWRDVLRTEIAAWESNQPNADSRMWADGIQPQGPRRILTAVADGRIVAFTGPVDLQKSGRGWFTGICTDPEYEHQGIASVLFNLLMQAFVDEGAKFSTLFTGLENRAQRIYLRAGMHPVRQFTLMSIAL